MRLMIRRVAGGACVLAAGGLLAAVAVSLALSAPLYTRGGKGVPAPPPSGTPSACDTLGSGVCAQFQSGQTFVTWDDVGTDGTTGGDTRYRVYRSTGPIDSGNYASATLIAKYVLNNSAQLFGGNPSVSSGASFTQTNRRSAAQPMAVLSDLGTPLPTFSGLQVYTAQATEDAYYAVVSTDTADASPSYIGSVGPISESVATPTPIKFADSQLRGQGYGKINSPAGKAIIFNAHASSSGGGACAAGQSIYGDYWEWFLTPAEGWQDGRATCLDVAQDGVGGYNFPSFTSQSGSLVIKNRDTVWTPNGLNGTTPANLNATAGLETFHFGMGLTPLSGTANRLYRMTYNAIARQLNWAISYYGADANQLHWTGTSMGAIAGTFVPYRMTSPQFSAVWLNSPTWRFDRSSPTWWAGVGWTSSMPFRATVAAAPSTLGATASAVTLDDGTGLVSYADVFTLLTASPGDDLPVAIWQIGKDDISLASSGVHGFQEEIDAVGAFQTAHRGHAMCWYTGAHDTGFNANGVVDADGVSPIAGVAYGKPLFKLNLPYIAFDHSSIDDYMGTGTRGAAGIVDGDPGGCINAGFTWAVSADVVDAFNFTIDNSWMDRAPTTNPSTTTTTAVASTGNGTIGLTSAAGFQSTSTSNIYFRIDNEIIKATLSGSTLTILSRGQLGTAAAAHSIGTPILQYRTQPSGPNAGPFTTMTVNVTPRRMQTFIKPNGTTINCTVTPNGDSPIELTGTVVGTHGVFTIAGVPINSTGATSLACD